jgi:predicted permease
MFQTVLNSQLLLLVLIICGYILKRVGIIDVHGQGVLSDVLINFILPCNIIHSFLDGTELTASIMGKFLLILVLSTAIQLIAYFGSRVALRRLDRKRYVLLSYGMICSNSSFVGLPVAQELYGNTGVMYTAILQIPVRVTMWSIGIAQFTGKGGKTPLKKILLHPCIVAIAIGLGLMALPVGIPAFFENAIHSVSRCTTPVSMITIGAILADSPLKSLLNRWTLGYSAVRLLLFPLFIFACLYFLPIDPLVRSVSVLMSGMPAGVTLSILAEKYDCDSALASQLMFVSTVLSIFTLPLLSMIL